MQSEGLDMDRAILISKQVASKYRALLQVIQHLRVSKALFL